MESVSLYWNYEKITDPVVLGKLFCIGKWTSNAHFGHAGQ